MTNDVFISYAPADKTVADAISIALENASIRCWIAPRDVLPGEPFAKAIIRAMNESRLFVLVFSAQTNESNHVKNEVERAVSKGLSIVVFRVQDVVPSAEMEYYLSRQHWLDAITPPVEAHFQKLVGGVKALLAASLAPDNTDLYDSLSRARQSQYLAQRPLPHDVFVSYAVKDKAVADRVCDALEKGGVHCWIAPRDIHPGESWAASIVDAIQASRLMVLVFSDAANDSPQVAREVALASDHGPIFVLRIGDAKPTGALEYYVGRTHWSDITEPSSSGSLGRVAAAVQNLLSLSADTAQTLSQTNTRMQPVIEAVAEISAQRRAAPRKLVVFLCHASEDKPAVRGLYQQLYAIGTLPWLDEENLLPGQNWQYEIPKAVRKSDVVVICLSHKSVTKAGYIQKEIRYALDVAEEQPEGTIFLIPARLERCEVPARLRDWQWVDLFDAQGLKRLTKALAERANGLGAETPEVGTAGQLLHPEQAKDDGKPPIQTEPFSSMIRTALQQRLVALVEEYTAANKQITYTLAAVDRLRLQRQMRGLEEGILEVERQLKSFG